MSLVEAGTEGSGGLVVVLTTVADEASAQALARALLDAELAACVQLSRIESLYRWEGEVVSEPEVRLVVKTPAARRTALVDALLARHPYDVPQIVVLGADAVHGPYLDWAREVTGGA